MTRNTAIFLVTWLAALSAGAAPPAAPTPAAPVAPAAPAAGAPSGGAPAAGGAQKPAARPDDLPKPAPRGDAARGRPPQLPPFFGLFGPAQLLQKTGFRGKVGSWVEFQARDVRSGGAPAGTVLFQQVGPEVRGARWIEMVAGFGGDTAALRLLARGEGDGNVERLVMQGPGMAPLEIPLDSAEISEDSGPAGALAEAAAMGVLKYAGRETVSVPLGRFVTDRWTLTADTRVADYWIAADPKVPFNGAVRMRVRGPEGADSGDLVATKVGTDAAARVPVPPL